MTVRIRQSPSLFNLQDKLERMEVDDIPMTTLRKIANAPLDAFIEVEADGSLFTMRVTNKIKRRANFAATFKSFEKEDGTVKIAEETEEEAS